MNHTGGQRRRLWPYILIATLLIACVGLGSFSVVFTGWSRFQELPSDEAAAAFQTQIAEMEDQRAYLTLSESGEVSVHRVLEHAEPSKLAALHLMSYEPREARLLHVRFPFWFVRVKTNDHLNLGTLVVLLAEDWQHLDLSVTEHDLMRRGPGLVLDHVCPDGGRIMLWSE